MNYYYWKELPDAQSVPPDNYVCGTTACLAGHAVLLFGDEKQKQVLRSETPEVLEEGLYSKYGATELLDLTSEQANNLFLDFSEYNTVALNYLGYIVKTESWCTPDEYLETAIEDRAIMNEPPK